MTRYKYTRSKICAILLRIADQFKVTLNDCPSYVRSSRRKTFAKLSSKLKTWGNGAVIGESIPSQLRRPPQLARTNQNRGFGARLGRPSTTDRALRARSDVRDAAILVHLLGGAPRGSRGDGPSHRRHMDQRRWMQILRALLPVAHATGQLPDGA